MPSYLRRRGHTWFLRVKWRVRLAACGLSGELIRSLRTGDFRIARRRALTVVLKLEAMTSSGTSQSDRRSKARCGQGQSAGRHGQQAFQQPCGILDVPGPSKED